MSSPASPRSPDALRDRPWGGVFRCEQHLAGTHDTIEKAEACIQGRPDCDHLGITSQTNWTDDGKGGTRPDGRAIFCRHCGTNFEARAASRSAVLDADIEEAIDRLDRAWNLMEPRVWTDDPELRKAGGPVEAICQDIYFALERLRNTPPGDMEGT